MIQTVAFAMSLAHQPDGFHERLHIEHDVVAPCAQIATQRHPFRPSLGRPPALAPPPMRHGDDVVYGRMPGGHFGKAFFHDPVHSGARHMTRNVADGRQHVDQIA